MPPEGTPATTQQGEKRQFVIKACLGRGGFGEVYRASMTNANGLETDVAVKVLHHDLDRDSQAVERLRDEGKMLGALVHAAILRVFDLVILDGRVGLVTEYVEGQDLSKCIRRGSAAEGPVSEGERMPPRAVAAVIGRVADALRAAWETVSPTTGEPLHLIHRDVKPQNIRIGVQGDVKLLDFGVARSSQVGREAQTSTGHMVGSYLYMAPECLLENRFGRESDVFALGATLYECLAHQRLFQDVSLREMYVLVLQDEDYLKWMAERFARLDAPPEMVDLLARMLARNAADRPTAAEISAICDDLVDALPGPTLRRWCKERAWPETDLVVGLLDGRTITEATMAASLRPDFARSPPPAPRRKRQVEWGMIVGTLGTVSLLLGLVIGTLGLAFVIGTLVMGDSGDRRVVRPPEPGLIGTIDGQGYTTPRRTEVGDASPRLPTPGPAPVGSGTILFKSRGDGVQMRLRRGSETYDNLARVPLGTYALEVDWRGGGFERVDEVRMRSGTVVVDCNRLTRQCDVQ